MRLLVGLSCSILALASPAFAATINWTFPYRAVQTSTANRVQSNTAGAFDQTLDQTVGAPGDPGYATASVTLASVLSSNGVSYAVDGTYVGATQSGSALYTSTNLDSRFTVSETSQWTLSAIGSGATMDVSINPSEAPVIAGGWGGSLNFSQTVTLQAGVSYVLRMKSHRSTAGTYSLDAALTQVPEPAAIGLMGCALAVVVCRRP